MTHKIKCHIAVAFSLTILSGLIRLLHLPTNGLFPFQKYAIKCLLNQFLVRFSVHVFTFSISDKRVFLFNSITTMRKKIYCYSRVHSRVVLKGLMYIFDFYRERAVDKRRRDSSEILVFAKSRLGSLSADKRKMNDL